MRRQVDAAHARAREGRGRGCRLMVLAHPHHARSRPPRWSGRAMALSGLRMMPPFPSLPLKFRTLGFPQYGFKASRSGRACPCVLAVKRAPRIPASTSGRLRPFARFRHGHSGLARCPRPAAPPQAAVRKAPAFLPQGVLRSGPSYVVSLPPRDYDPIRQSREHAATSRIQPLIRRAFAVREPLGTSRDLPYFPPVLAPRAAAPTPVGPLPLPVVRRRRGTRLPRFPSESPPTSPVSASHPRRGAGFRRCIVRVRLRPVCLPSPPGWLRRGQPDALPSPSEDIVTPALRAARRRPALGVRLEGRTGNLPSSGLSPDQFTAGSEAAR